MSKSILEGTEKLLQQDNVDIQATVTSEHMQVNEV
jgi:hypothetical protein